ncbi:MAG: hypothetical protein Q7S26_01105 [bacterium]|nr:hypothetical protein [bacterium]
MFSLKNRSRLHRVYTVWAAAVAIFFLVSAVLIVSIGIVIPAAHASGICAFGSDIGGGLCRGYLTSGTSFTVPLDWDPTNNTIETIGGGGGGAGGTPLHEGGDGGGGGAYSKISNLSLTPGASVIYQVGAAGTAGPTGGGGLGGNGGDTYFCDTTSNCVNISGTAVKVGAKGGKGTLVDPNALGGVGGAAASGIGTIKYSGGHGGTSSYYDSGIFGYGAGGGGGAGGPGGDGKNGGSPVSDGGAIASGGGGGNSAGTDGQNASSNTVGGNGGNNSSAAGGGLRGAPGAAGTSGGGGGGANGGNATQANNSGGAGGGGIQWDATHGAGGGGGGAGARTAGGTGSNGKGGAGGGYGGAGGGGFDNANGGGGAGAQGIIVITYGPIRASTVTGYAWSDAPNSNPAGDRGVGWIHFNGTNYGVDEDTATGALSGQAWSEHVGWISFDSADLVGCPSGTCSAQVDLTTGAVTGWARALSPITDPSPGGWDGWIHLSGSNYAVTQNPSTCAWSGYAWGGDILGWIKMAGTAQSGSFYGVLGQGGGCSAPPPSAPAVNLYANPNAFTNSVGGDSTLTWDSTGATSCNDITNSNDASTISTGASGSASNLNNATGVVAAVTQTIIYTIQCLNTGGSTNGVVTVTVSAPSITSPGFYASPSRVARGGTSYLLWSSSGFDSCTVADVNGNSVTVLSPGTSSSGTQTPVVVTQAMTYTLTCTGVDGTASATASVRLFPSVIEK